MFDGIFQPMHLLVILFIALLVFGPKKLADLGKGLGEGIRGFKEAIKEEPKPLPASQTTVESTQQSQSNTTTHA